MKLYWRAAFVLTLLLMPVLAGDSAIAEAQPLSEAQQACLNGYNSCRAPCYGKRNPGPCLSACRANYNICKRQAR
ncbi:MAG: hypothetical protein ACPW61_13135 [Methyloligella sp. ZOD6]